jgi:hypothetical protein
MITTPNVTAKIWGSETTSVLCDDLECAVQSPNAPAAANQFAVTE